MGGGQTYQIPEVLKNENYNKSVDLFLFGCLAYEVLFGVPAFPLLLSDTEQENRIINCEFTFPEHGCDLAKKMISGLLKPNGKERISLSSLKKHKFFNCILEDQNLTWADVLKRKLEMPPKSRESTFYEPIEYDSDD